MRWDFEHEDEHVHEHEEQLISQQPLATVTDANPSGATPCRRQLHVGTLSVARLLKRNPQFCLKEKPCF